VILLKTKNEIQKMRDSGRIVAEILLILQEKAGIGVTSRELDIVAEKECIKRKARPAFKGYAGFPYTICASLNHEVVHGFADDVPLQDGDILSVDFGVQYNGYFGDAAITIPIGLIDDEKKCLNEVTRESLNQAVAATQPGNRISDISWAVQSYVEARGFSVVRDFVGHGIGKKLHEAPQVPNFGQPGHGARLKPGMVLAIEPMVNAGSAEIKILADGWTAVTADGRPSSHFEHTVAITANGPVILTLP
jgi:methionyl aminopeptidase